MGQELGRISGAMLKANLEIAGPYLAVDTDLLYLDADNMSIGINSTATNAQTSLTVNAATKTIELIVDTELRLPNLTINANTNTISASSGDLHLIAATSIISSNIRTDDLNLNDNIISSTSSNQSIELQPAGTGAVVIPTSLNVTGNLFATGDILIEGTVVFGDTTDAVTETVDINAKVNSDIDPIVSDVWSLGSNPAGGGNRWLNVYTDLLNGEAVTVASAQANGVNLTQRQGNTWYVSQNGSDTNYGDHEASTFLTIKRALNNVALESGDTIIVYPGTYTEIFPLTVPVGVAIRGTSIRSVTIIPTAGTNTESAFLLNGETTVGDLTVKDFYAPGYAFSFAPNASISTRSPYVQNVTVITKGTVTSASDPRGFAAGDAGGGALVNGASVNSASKEASMLFHSVTFITPGVDALVMTNGVRVEWLNSFTYFANRAMYATSGVGRIDSNNSVTRYGAEVRAIGSACVYGNYGAWADGSGTLMYLINHNFSYIGSGKDSTNDPSVHNSDNEITMLDSGDIHYQSFDNDGHFHIGNPFSVSFNDGTASINGVSVTATGVSSILFGSETSETIVDAGVVSTGNIKFSGNTLTTTLGSINLVPGVGKINLTSDVSAKQNIAIDNDFSLKGVLTLGNQLVDIAEFKAPANSDILPSANRIYGLGIDYSINGPEKRWNKVINQLSVIDGNIQLFDNVIQTSQSNSDLELRTHGAGTILLENNSLTITDQLTVNGDTSTQAISVVGNINQLGDTLQTGDRNISNGVDLTGNISATVEAQLETITVSQGSITTTASNADLELRAAGTGQIVFPTSSVVLQNNLTVNSTMIAGDAVIAGDVVAATFNNSDINITANRITTINSNSSLELRAHGTGEVIAPLADVEITQDLTIDSLSTLSNLFTVGDKIQIGDIVQTGTLAQTGNYQLSKNLTVTENAYFTDIEIVNNNLSTRNSNSDLEFTAAGTGKVVVPTSNVIIENDLTVNGLMTANNAVITNDIVSSQFDIPDISFYANNIVTRGTDQDLILGAHGTGLVISETSDVLITQNLQVDGLSTIGNAVIGKTLTTQVNQNLSGTSSPTGFFYYGWQILNPGQTVPTFSVIQPGWTVVGQPTWVVTVVGDGVTNYDITITGGSFASGGTYSFTGPDPATLSVTGTINRTGNVTETGNYVLSNNLTVSLGVQFANIEIENNVISTTDSNSDLELRASGTGLVKVDDNFRIENNLNVNGITATNGLINSGIIASDTFRDNDIEISTNVIKTTVGNNDLRLLAAGTGVISVPNDAVQFNQNLTVNGITDMTSVQIGQENASISLIQTLSNPTASGTSALDNFAKVVAVSGNYAIVGVPTEDGAGGRGESFSGYVYIFNVTTGALVHTLANPNAFGLNRFDFFGWSVAISDNYAIVGVPDEDVAGGINSGKAYVFNVTTGALVHTLDNPNAYGASANDEFGDSVAISGNYAIVGAPQEDDASDASGSASGKAYIFNVTTGALVHTLDNPNAYGTSASDFFGVRVAISGNYAIVGSSEADAGGAYAGKAYIFNVTTGALVHTLNNPNAYSTSASDQFGIAVAISGNYAIVGARNEGDAGGTSSGKAYIFNVTTGALVHTLDNPNAYGTSVSDQFGESVAISGEYAIVGVPDEDDAGGTTSGKVYIFNVTTGALLYTLDNPNAYDTSAGDNFGNAVAISGDYIIVGALTEDDAGGVGSGKAYVFSGLPNPATLTVTGTINRTGNTTETGNYTLSNNLTVSGTVSLANIDIDNNVITTTDSNSDLELRAAAGGRIYASYGNVAITNDLRVNGITTTSIINNSGTAYSDTFNTTDLIISQNYITSQPNTNIKLIAAGLGNVVLPKITFDANAIKATALNNNIDLTVSAGSVIIPATDALKIPVGTTADKSTNTVGDIRLDTTDTLFTGWNGARVTFGGLFSTDRRTTLLAHSTNNSINFVTNTNATMSLTASGLTVNALLVNSDLQITGTTISSTVAGSDITLTPNNNGYLELGNIRINTNNIQNVDTSSNIILENTGAGYVKFGGTGAIAIPAGIELTRPASPETGDFRFNTNLSTAEVFNGIDYVSLGGTSNALLTAEEITEITNLFSLVLG